MKTSKIKHGAFSFGLLLLILLLAFVFAVNASAYSATKETYDYVPSEISVGNTGAGATYFGRDYPGFSVSVDGDVDRLKIEPVQPYETLTVHSNKDNTYEATFFKRSASDKYRLLEHYGVYDGGSSANGVYKYKDVVFADPSNHTGYVSGDAKFKISYDFNGDGKWTSDEVVTTAVYHVDADPDRAIEYAIAKKAVASAGTNNYEDDMGAIKDYIKANYSYYDYVEGLSYPMNCVGGAKVLQTWSIEKYGVQGYLSYKSKSNTAHVEFFPDSNPYTVKESFYANGYE